MFDIECAESVGYVFDLHAQKDTAEKPEPPLKEAI